MTIAKGYGRDAVAEMVTATGTGYTAKESVDTASPFHRLEQALEHLRETRAHVARLADRLVGSLPETGEEDPIPDRAGLIGNIEDAVDEVHRVASRIMEDVQRVEGRL